MSARVERKRSRSRDEEHRLESMAFGISPAKIAKACSLGAELQSKFKPKKTKNEPVVDGVKKEEAQSEAGAAATVGEAPKVASGEIAEVEMTPSSPAPAYQVQL